MRASPLIIMAVASLALAGQSRADERMILAGPLQECTPRNELAGFPPPGTISRSHQQALDAL